MTAPDREDDHPVTSTPSPRPRHARAEGVDEPERKDGGGDVAVAESAAVVDEPGDRTTDAPTEVLRTTDAPRGELNVRAGNGLGVAALEPADPGRYLEAGAQAKPKRGRYCRTPGCAPKTPAVMPADEPTQCAPHYDSRRGDVEPELED